MKTIVAIEIANLKIVKRILNVDKEITANNKERCLYMVQKTYEVIEELPFRYVVRYEGGNKEHLNRYLQIASRFKNKALANIQDLNAGLISNDYNRCISVLDDLITSKFYTEEAKSIIDSWYTSSDAYVKKYEYQKITI